LRRLAAGLVVMMLSGSAWAGGMFLPGRGVRPLGRGGAFTAGADDVGAIAYNPAGLAELRSTSLLLDVGLVMMDVGYARVDSGGVRRPEVQNQGPPTPIPTLGIAVPVGDKLVLSGGMFAPTTNLPKYPIDGPQRYSIVDLDGTLIAALEAAAAVRIGEHVRIGAGLQLWVLNFSSQVMLSSCPGETICAPEDHDYDALSQVVVADVLPSGNVGVQGVWSKVRVGAAVQLPVSVDSGGKVRARLPRAAYFDGAFVKGEDATVKFTLPAALRFGVEVRPMPRLRFEAELDVELWSQHETIEIDTTRISIENVRGVGSYQLSPVRIERHFENVLGIHLGGELEVHERVTLRAGYAYEPSAVPSKYLQLLSPDGDKHLIAIGGSARLGKLRLDLTFAHVLQGDREVTDSVALQQNPIRPAGQVVIGNGSYHVAANILGLGAAYTF
jgi:long-chain fatty acid transport protein